MITRWPIGNPRGNHGKVKIDITIDVAIPSGLQGTIPLDDSSIPTRQELIGHLIFERCLSLLPAENRSKLLGELTPKFDKAWAEQMLLRHDLNRDGKLSRTEFASLQESLRQTGGVAPFDELDLDDNHAITLDELKHWAGYLENRS